MLRGDALRKAEDLGGVIAALDLAEPRQVRAVEGLLPSREARVDVVLVRLPRAVRAQVAAEGGEPAVGLPAAGRRGPVGEELGGGELVAVDEGRRVWGHPGECPAV